MKIKTRFAPSPTGNLHIGSIRTALYSWLFARKYGGSFILRIEDTDLDRSNNNAIKSIIDSMHWLNLNWDEGPYFQTQRLDRYHEIINLMLKNGNAYKCFCSKERLTKLRKLQIKKGIKPRYDLHCRNIKNNVTINIPFVIRFRNPLNGIVVFKDLIRGIIKFNNHELDDLIILRCDGVPTYNFCVVIDDLDMNITHVIRGEDHINNTPRQINIIKSLKADIPQYAHVSTIINNDGKKLSKRYGSTNVMQFRDEGFLPEALLNHLVRLGWSKNNQEIFSIDDMKKYFNLKNLGSSTSTFNIDKLLWLNHYYINHLPENKIADYLSWHMKQQNIDITDGPSLIDLVKLLRNRCKTIKEIAIEGSNFYTDLINLNEIAANKYLTLETIKLLKLIKNKLSLISKWDLNNVSIAIKQTIIELNINMVVLGMPLRVAITGRDYSPSINNTIFTLGKKRSIFRIDHAINFIKNKFI